MSRSVTRRGPRPAAARARLSARLVGWATWPYTLVVVGVAVLVGSVGVLTWFAALTAGVRAVRGLLVDGDDRVWRSFWAAYRTDLPRRVRIGAVLLAVLAVVVLNAMFLHGRPDPVAVPLLALNLAWSAVWVVMTAVAAQLCARRHPGSALQVLRAAATEALTIRAGHAVVLSAVALAAVLILLAPLPGLLFSAGLAVLGVAAADLLPGRTASPGGPSA
jgi:uncharacterized membrane protein YesL